MTCSSMDVRQTPIPLTSQAIVIKTPRVSQIRHSTSTKTKGNDTLQARGIILQRLPWTRTSPQDRQAPLQSISPSIWIPAQAGIPQKAWLVKRIISKNKRGPVHLHRPPRCRSDCPGFFTELRPPSGTSSSRDDAWRPDPAPQPWRPPS